MTASGTPKPLLSSNPQASHDTVGGLQGKKKTID
jgi:hypothetical protein